MLRAVLQPLLKPQIKTEEFKFTQETKATTNTIVTEEVWESSI